MKQTTITVFDSRIVRIPWKAFHDSHNKEERDKAVSAAIKKLSEMFGPTWHIGKITENNIEWALELQWIREGYEVVFEL